ncbi:D-glycerate dehydrogenase [Myxococcota bacterium]|nr:D-glycerate dehydrogenase [Myxococcota bacterium]MBU1381640.1 D-glycerate dehydrogenase [Myxococcota bacterium]MBU1495469.1 D-glycerate dehydrogenase [Myxococcota bacterium]
MKYIPKIQHNRITQEAVWIKHTGNGPAILSTSALYGRKWLDILLKSGFSVTLPSDENVLTMEMIDKEISAGYSGVISLLKHNWDWDKIKYLKECGVKIISNYAVGVNNIDLKAAQQAQIQVGNTPGVLTDATSDLACGLILGCARRLGEGERLVRGGQWQGWAPDQLTGKNLRGGILGIIGAGKIGSDCALKMAAGFGMNIMYYSRTRKPDLEEKIGKISDMRVSIGLNPISVSFVTLESLLKYSDIAAIFVNLSEETHHLIGSEQLSLMKEDALLINVSRGSVIDEQALYEHLRNHGNFRAGLDVYEKEPVIFPGLSELENAFLQPHLGSANCETRENMAIIAGLNIKNYLEGMEKWPGGDLTPFVTENPPSFVPSVLFNDF